MTKSVGQIEHWFCKFSSPIHMRKTVQHEIVECGWNVGVKVSTPNRSELCLDLNTHSHEHACISLQCSSRYICQIFIYFRFRLCRTMCFQYQNLIPSWCVDCVLCWPWIGSTTFQCVIISILAIQMQNESNNNWKWSDGYEWFRDTYHIESGDRFTEKDGARDRERELDSSMQCSFDQSNNLIGNLKSIIRHTTQLNIWTDMKCSVLIFNFKQCLGSSEFNFMKWVSWYCIIVNSVSNTCVYNLNDYTVFNSSHFDILLWIYFRSSLGFNGALCHFNRFVCFCDKEMVQPFSDFIACSIQFNFILDTFEFIVAITCSYIVSVNQLLGGRQFLYLNSPSSVCMCVHFERV